MNSDYQRPSGRRFVTKQLAFRNPYYHRPSSSDQRRRKVRILILLGLIFFIAAAYLLCFSPLLIFAEISIEGGGLDRVSYIKNKVELYLAGKTLGFLPHDNFLLLIPSRLKRGLEKDLENFISLEYLAVKKRFPRTLLITFKERTAELILRQGTELYLVDGQGVVISRQEIGTGKQTDSSDGTDAKALPYPFFQLDKSFSITLGERIIPSDLARAILAVSHSFPQRFGEIPFDYFEVLVRKCPVSIPESPVENKNIETNTNENSNINSTVIGQKKEILPDCTTQPLLEFSLVVKDGPSIIFSSTQSIEEQLNSLGLTLKEKLDNKLEQLDYVDLRYLPRVYYK